MTLYFAHQRCSRCDGVSMYERKDDLIRDVHSWTGIPLGELRVACVAIGLIPLKFNLMLGGYVSLGVMNVKGESDASGPG